MSNYPEISQKELRLYRATRWLRNRKVRRIAKAVGLLLLIILGLILIWHFSIPGVDY